MIPPGTTILRIFGGAIVVAGMLAPAGLAQEPAKPVPAPPKPPAYREIWVPTEHLDAVLAKMPRAVMLTPEQYEALLRDAERVEKPADPALKAPVAALVRDVVFKGELTNDVARITAHYSVESFTDEWSEIPLVLPLNRLAHIEVDDQSAIRVTPPAGKGKSSSPVLVVRGKGEHAVSAEFHLPVSRSPAGNAIQFISPGVAAASMRLTIPDDAKLDSSLPFVTGEEDPNVAKFVLPAEGGKAFEIRWTARDIDAIPDAAVFQTCSYLYSIDSTRVQADLGLVLSSSLAELPNRFQIVLPDGVRILSVEGSELLSWDAIAAGPGTGIEVVLVAGKRQAADIRILVEADVEADADADVTVTLPIADVSEVHRASGTMALIGSDDVRVKNITTGPLTVAAPEALEPAVRDHPDFVTGFRFPVSTAPPAITLSPVQERFNVQLDTRIELKREAIHLRRNFTVIPLEGRLFETELALPAGEELITVAPAAETAGFSWSRLEGNRVRLAWQEGLVANDSPPALVIESRLDPENWFDLSEEAMSLAFANAAIADAETVSGYVAVAFDESFRVETVTADGLEPRDARTTPVAGTLAWFRIADYALELSAARRATEVEAAVTAYALPLQSSLEIEGQLDLQIRYTPLAEVVVKLDPAVAEFVRWDSPLLAEKRLDETTGEWTLDFHEELSGFQRLRFRMALPFELEEAGGETEQKKFAVSAPVFSLPGAKRVRGDWIIEANTDTELRFEANGVDSVDSLRVPGVAGYRPRHRVIAAYQYRGDAYDLKIAGTRHAPEQLVTTVVDALRIDTVVSTDGPDRHQARISLRTSGEQFLEVALPKGAVVWTLTVDGASVKPVSVEDSPDTLRVQLPAHEDASRQAIALKLIYQTQGKKWGGSGRETLEPIRLAGRIPVMRSDWFLHLPEGFDYQRFKSNLRESFEVIDRTLLGQVWEERDRFLPEMPRVAYAYAQDEAPSQTLGGDHDQSRAEFLQRVAEGWEVPVPTSIASSGTGGGWEIPLELGSPSTGNEWDGPDADRIARIERALKTIIIPNIDFVNTPLNDALDYLRARAQEIDPNGQGISFIVDLGMNLGGGPPTAPNQMDSDPFGGGGGGPVFDTAPSGGAPGFGGGGAVDTQITLNLSNVPLGEALGYVLKLANLKYTIQPQAVVILPLSAPDTDLYAVDYAVPPNMLPKVLTEGVPGGQSGRRVSGRELFESYGVVFGPGAGVNVDESTGRITVRNTADQQDLVVAVMESLRSDLDPDAPNLWAFRQTKERIGQGQGLITEDAVAMDMDTDRIGSLEDKLKSIIIPRVEFVNTPLRDALLFLRQRAKELDGNPDPNSRGVDFILDLGSNLGGTFGGGGAEDTPITLQLSNVPLGEALGYTLKLANLKYKVEPQAVVILPVSAPDTELYTNTYVVPPNFLSLLPGGDGGGGAAAVDPFAAPAAAGGGAGVSARRTAREVLEAQGIEFGPGTNASYDPVTGTLIVRQKEEQMDLLESALQAAIEGSKPTPEEEEKLLARGIMVDSETGEQVPVGNGGLADSTLPADQISQTLRDLVIPELNIENKSLPEAVNLLNEKAREAAAGRFTVAPQIELRAEAEASGRNILLNLKNTPLAEALDRLARSSATEYQVTASGVAIVAPGTIPSDTIQTLVLELPNSAFEIRDNSGGVYGIGARTLLEGAGIAFPPGTSAAYNRTTQRLAVKNTAQNLQLVRQLFDRTLAVAAAPRVPGAFSGADRPGAAEQVLASAQALGLKGFDFRNTGLIPLDFELPQSGRSYAFGGLYAPEPIKFRYVNWERQIRFAWFWILVGALGFWLGAVRKWKRPVAIGLLVVIVLTFAPLILSQSLLAFCNSLLIGWLLGGGLWLAWKIRMGLSRFFAAGEKNETRDAGEAAATTV